MFESQQCTTEAIIKFPVCSMTNAASAKLMQQSKQKGPQTSFVSFDSVLEA